MWPTLLDMTEDESVESLRHLELEAYSSLVSALRAQGTLNQEKRNLLKETSILLNISNERHKAEVRRAISDERLNTIAYRKCYWAIEFFGRLGIRRSKTCTIIAEVPPQTPYSIIADEASDTAVQYNSQLPLPANTERKRPATSPAPSVSTNDVAGKTQTFRVPEVPKEDFKKRKSYAGENSSLAQHLLGNKISRIQQIYRQASKISKHKHKDLDETESKDLIKASLNPNSVHNRVQTVTAPTTVNSQKINIIQNVSIPPMMSEKSTETNITKEVVSENHLPNPKSVNNVTFLKQSSSDDTSDPVPKMNTNKTINKGKKLIVVSNASTITTNSILQKTLSVPMNKLTKLNLDKFKIVGNSQFPSNLQLANTQNLSPKLVTFKGNTTKKVIPFSQLQMLHSKGLKMVPYSGKVFDKHIKLSNLQSGEVPVKKNVISVQNSNSLEKLKSTEVLPENTLIEELQKMEDSITIDDELPEDDIKMNKLGESNTVLVDSDQTDSNSEENEITDTDEDC
ncbi:BRCA2-interacting transcriptional repressor EMSY-like, partial [Sitophilus oryzae]|uniref:BRCA2-interacting transcriptional repressor EMSY-like n=1 Tax=Sitophilus oryzae TaxID=7048 RepID=A0A6J2Y5V5_SITOR